MEPIIWELSLHRMILRSADGTNVNLTGIAFAGNTLNLRADNVRREGNQDADLKADIITVQVKG